MNRMNKKFLALLCLFSQLYCADQSAEYEKGKASANGAMDAVTERLVSADISKEVVNAVSDVVGKAVGESIKQAMNQTGSSFKKGGEFDNLTQEAGASVRRNLNTVAHEVGLGLDESSESIAHHAGSVVSNFGRALGDNTGKGSDLDLGIGELSGTGIRHANNFIWEVGGKNALMFGGIGLGVLGTGVTFWYGAPLAFKMLERYWTRPKLIIESSKQSYSQWLTSFIYTRTPLDMVFSPALKEQLDDTVKVTSAINAKIKSGKTNVKYRNLMLYGPPGTGKTMFAKELAKRSGLEYAFMSGSSFSKFKDGEGIEALDELFAWAKRSKGLMIFIDEAETFLSKRENMDPQSKAYQLLNNFLNYTGERSDRFMLVFATNHQNSLDSAMYRRIDDLIEMPLPSKMQRIEALLLYKNKILMDLKQNGKAFVDSVEKYLNNQAIDTIAERTKGLSYGDIEGIINTLRTDADILTPAILNPNLINKVVDRAIKKHETFTQGKLLGSVED
jgi:hypothetical protein